MPKIGSYGAANTSGLIGLQLALFTGWDYHAMGTDRAVTCSRSRPITAGTLWWGSRSRS